MLGIAASNSTRNETGRSSQRGASSERKIATPMLRGRAMTNARRDDASVPKINGSAPYSSATGSHVVVVRNFHPKCLRDNSEPRTISYAIRKTRANTKNANSIVVFLKTLSPVIDNFILFIQKQQRVITRSPKVITRSLRSVCS